jgi:hypothetical protein
MTLDGGPSPLVEPSPPRGELRPADSENLRGEEEHGAIRASELARIDLRPRLPSSAQPEEFDKANEEAESCDRPVPPRPPPGTGLSI